jgi:peroxiredoxin Q/BCP
MSFLKKLFLVQGALIGSASFFSQKVNAQEIKVGDPAPVLTGVTHSGESLELKSLTSKGKVLVYFYPKADTPGCTAQACSLRDSYVELQKKGVEILGVSTDGVEDLKKFRAKHRLPFFLISDKEKKWAQAFSVSTMFGFTSRQAFLIEDSKITWIDRTASTDKQAKDVLEVLNSRP